MTRNQAIVFVLWADNFDEVATAVFVTELRKAGLRVKVVGLTPRQLSGIYGLILVPDLTLDQALAVAEQAICLVIPHNLQGVWSLDYDPRVKQLFISISANQGRFVIGPSTPSTANQLLPFAVPNDNIVVYPEGAEIIQFARRLARLLVEGQS